MSKPVLSSDTKPVQRILEQEHCGLIYRHTDPFDFAKMATLLLDRNLRKRLGENGFTAIEQRYNWRIDSEEMLRDITSLAFSMDTTKNEDNKS